MPIGFILGQLSRGKVDLENDMASFEAHVRQLRRLLFEDRLLTQAVRPAVTEVEEAARVLLRHRYERCLSPEDVENFHRAVDNLKAVLDGR